MSIINHLRKWVQFRKDKEERPRVVRIDYELPGY